MSANTAIGGGFSLPSSTSPPLLTLSLSLAQPPSFPTMVLFLLCLRAEKLENVAKVELPAGHTYVMDVR